MNAPPETPARADSYEYHGETIEDPYLWLEEESEAVRDWVQEQDRYAESELQRCEGRDQLSERLTEITGTTQYNHIVPRPSGYFQERRAPDREQAVLFHRASLDDSPQKLIDSNRFTTGIGQSANRSSRSVKWYVPSPDGELVVYGVVEGWEENYELRVADVGANEHLDTVPDAGQVHPPMIAWSGDGFYYVRTGLDRDGDRHKEVRYHELGDDLDEERVIHVEEDPQIWPRLETAPETEYVVLARAELDGRADLYRFRHGVQRPELNPLIVDTNATFDLTVDGEELYFRTTFGAPNYRLARLELTSSLHVEDPDDLETIVEEPETGILDAFALAGDRILVKTIRDVVAELHVHDKRGQHITTVELPGSGSVSNLYGSHGAEEWFFQYESFETPKEVHRYEADANTSEVVDRPSIDLQADFRVTQAWVESADGTSVPVFVTHKRGIERDGSNPALLYGYGHFGECFTPFFAKYAVPFLEAGGVFAVANPRGGGELGKAWHHAGRGEHKQRTFDDFLAAAEHLIDAAYTSPDRLACWGTSGGGLTVGAAITQRPELFAACLFKSGLSDMLRYHRSKGGSSWIPEYGHPAKDPKMFEYVRSYSPYHNVEPAEYPATLLVTAERESRVDPFHARKFAARLQACQQAEAPIVLKIHDSAAHGGSSSVSDLIERKVDEWGFIQTQLDISLPNY